MIKRMFTVLCLSLMLSIVPCSADFIDTEPGDVFLWTSDYIAFGVLQLPVDILSIIYGEVPSFTHSDLCVDDSGRLRTSIQGKGVSSSTVESRKKGFNSGVQLRNPYLPENVIDAVCDAAYELSGDYDYGGYDGQILDFLLRIPYTPRGYLFTSIFQDPELYYCSEFVVECFLMAETMSFVRVHPAPNDIYVIVGHTLWEVVGTWEE